MSLKRGQEILVQVSKEPISTKGPRVTAQISLAGRFLVYMPVRSRVGVSRKIGERAERQRLQEQVAGRSCRTNPAASSSARSARTSRRRRSSASSTTLMAQWKQIKRKTHFVARAGAASIARRASRAASSATSSATRSSSLTVDSKQVYNEIIEYLKGIAPELIDRVKLYEEQVPLFDKPEIETEIRDLFKRRCDLPSGGYLIIEPTEALVSIDVNSGRYTGKKDPEKTILKTNIEAAREVARQLRLRDVGGIIVCDFIDMETKANRDQVLQELRTHLGRDRARTKAFAVSDLGLIEMTRQRVRQSHLPEHDRAVPDLPRHGPRVHAGDDRPPHGAVGEADGGRGQARQPAREAAPRRRDVRAGAGAGPRAEAREGGGFSLELRDDPLLQAGRVQAGREGRRDGT